MIDQLFRLAKHSGIYGVGIVLSKAVGFLMIPVYMRFLSPHDYGILELLDLIIFFAGIFAAMGIYEAVFRFYAAYQSEQDKKEVIATALLYSSGISLLFAVAMIFWAPAIARGILGSATHASFVRIISLTLLFSNLAEVPLAYWRAQGRTVLFVSVGLGRTLLGVLLIACSLAVLKMGVKGPVYANLVTNVITGSTLFGIVSFHVPKKIVKDKLKEMLWYGIPLVPWSIASFVIIFSDRFFLRHFGNLAEVGVYALGYKLAAVVTVAVSAPFRLVWQWQQFELAKQQDARQMFAKIQMYLFLVSVLLGLAVAVMAKDVIRIISPPSYWAAARIVPLIVLCFVLDDIRNLVLSGIYIQRATHYLARIAAVISVTNLLLNYVLISRYLALGAAIATALSYAVNLLLCYYVAQRVYFIRYEYARNAIVLGSATLIYVASTLHSLQLASSIVANLSLLVLFLVISLSLLGREERGMFRQLGLKVAHELRRGWMRV